MTLTIKRLHELSEAELKALSAFLVADINPASITEGSDWVCQALQRPYFWNEKGMADIQANEGNKTWAWVAFDPDPVGICMVEVEVENWNITLFNVDTSLTPTQQFEVADALALRSLGEGPKRKGIYGWFPKLGQAAAYAKRCGFTMSEGKQMIPIANPIVKWTTTTDDLERTIKGFQQVTPR